MAGQAFMWSSPSNEGRRKSWEPPTVPSASPGKRDIGAEKVAERDPARTPASPGEVSRAKQVVKLAAEEAAEQARRRREQTEHAHQDDSKRLSERKSRSGPRAEIIDTLEEHNKSCSVACGEHTFYFVRVLKGKTESRTQVLNAEYTITLDKTNGKRLGLKIEIRENVGVLYITEVISGLAQEWNSVQPDQSCKVKAGDLIVAVNDVRGRPNFAHLLNEESKKRSVLTITLRRSLARAATPGRRLIVTKAFGQLSEGMWGEVIRVDDDGDALLKFVSWGTQWVAKEKLGCFAMEDGEMFYLKRFQDFKDFYVKLRQRVEAGQSSHLRPGSLPELPKEERMGFRRMMSNLTSGSFLTKRKEALQGYLDRVMSQVPSLSAEPAVAEFFGANQVPQIDMQEILQQRLDAMIDEVLLQRRRRAAQAQPALQALQPQAPQARAHPAHA